MVTMERLQNIDVLQSPRAPAFLFGFGSGMQTLNDIVSEIARTDIPVLIVGETGSGKDAYARQIHRLSSRSELPFRKFSGTSLDPATGPYQGGHCSSNGLAAEAWGTVYLDNVQDLDPSAQRNLLAWLPDGDDYDAKSGQMVRITSSASMNFESHVELGAFRRELYFRLNGACLRIPPLRERIEDIPIFVEHFLAKHSTILKRVPPRLDKKTIQALTAYPWPGNIRELENFARKAVLFGGIQPALEELQFSGTESANKGVTQVSSLKSAARAASKNTERQLILQALQRTHWNRKKAARDLQISYKSLLYKIKQIAVTDGKHEDMREDS